MTTTGFRVQVDGPVATVTLDRPEARNAQTPAMWLALSEFARSLSGDVRIVVVRGEGPSFSAGLDRTVMGSELAGMASLPAAEAADRIASYQEGFTWAHRPDLLTIAAVQGHAIGAGFQLALACDLRVVAEDVSFSMAEVTLGLVPDLAGTKRLVELVGYARALELCVTGRRIGAAEADRIGLANLVVQFQILSLNGAAPPAHLRGWKDTVFVPEDTRYRLIMRFTGPSDPNHAYMFHCHVLYHEDSGMMGQFVITDNGAPSGHVHSH
jgi:enoyl-CoA hydratase/carnithine racemase